MKSWAIGDSVVRGRRVRAVLGAALAVALVVALLQWAGPRALAAWRTPLPAWALAGFVIALGGSHLMRALRVHAEWHRRAGVGLGECLNVTLLHNGAIHLLPFRSGELAYPWLLHRRWGVPVASAAASLMRMRIQDAVVLAPVAWLAWAPFEMVFVAGGALVILGGVAVAIRIARWDASGWVYTAGNWALKLLAIGALLSLLASLAATRAIAAALGGELAALMPLQGPGGLGTYEAGVWAGAALGGGARGEIVGAALLVHALVSAVAGIAAAAAWVLQRYSTQTVDPQPVDRGGLP